MRDLVGKAGPLTATGSGAVWARDIFGTVPDINGATSTYLSSPNGLSSTGIWTFEAWIKPTVATQPQDGGLGVLWGDAGDNVGVYMDSSTSSWGVYDGFAYQKAGTTALTNGTWMHVVVQFDGSNTTTFYTNGSPDGSHSGALTAQTLQYHGGNTGGGGYQGRFGLIRIWSNRLLTAGDVQQLYADPWSMISTPLTRRFQLLIPATTVAPSASGAFAPAAFTVASSATEIFSASAALKAAVFSLAAQESYETASAALAPDAFSMAATEGPFFSASAGLTPAAFTVVAAESEQAVAAPLAASVFTLAASASEIFSASAALKAAVFQIAAAELEQQASAALQGAGFVLSAAATLPDPIGQWIDCSPSVSFDFNNPTTASNYGIQGAQIDPTDGSFYVTTCYQGLYKSTDKGLTWSKVSTGSGGSHLDTGRCWELQIDPFNHQHIWTTAGYGDGGPLKSTDGGVTWTLTFGSGSGAAWTTVNTSDVYGIALSPYTQDLVLASFHSPWAGSSDSGLIKSTDGGATWTTIAAPAAGVGAGCMIWFLDSDAHLLFGTQDQGVYRSTNGGTSWTQVISTSMTHGAINGLLRDVNTPSTWYLPTTTDMLRSTDNGATWATLNTGLGGNYLQAVGSDGVHLYTQSAFPIDSYGASATPFYSYPLPGGPWAQMGGGNPNTTHAGNSNGPNQIVYDRTSGYMLASNWLGGAWKQNVGAQLANAAAFVPGAFSLASTEREQQAAGALALAAFPLAAQASYETAAAAFSPAIFVISASASEIFSAASALLPAAFVIAAQESYETASAAFVLNAFLFTSVASEQQAGAAFVPLAFVISASALEIFSATSALVPAVFTLAAQEAYETASAALTPAAFVLAANASFTGLSAISANAAFALLPFALLASAVEIFSVNAPLVPSSFTLAASASEYAAAASFNLISFTIAATSSFVTSSAALSLLSFSLTSVSVEIFSASTALLPAPFALAAQEREQQAAATLALGSFTVHANSLLLLSTSAVLHPQSFLLSSAGGQGVIPPTAAAAFLLAAFTVISLVDTQVWAEVLVDLIHNSSCATLIKNGSYVKLMHV